MHKRRLFFEWLLFIAWVLFVNAVDTWLITPLVEDYAIEGTVVVFVIVLLWLTSIPKTWRKKWISFTLFGLLLGQGLSDISSYPLHTRIPLGLLMCVGLLIVTYWFSKLRFSTLVVSTLTVVIVNSALPISEWPFLTHFDVVYYGRMNFDPADMSSLPLTVVDTGHGQAVVTVNNVKENRVQFEKNAENALDTPDALSNYLHAYRHRYTLIEVTEQGSHFTVKPASPDVVAKINPDKLVGAFFPFTRAYWTVSGNQVLQYMTPAETPRNFMLMSMFPADFPSNVSGLAVQTDNRERANWQSLLDTLGVASPAPSFKIENGVLTGNFGNRTIHVPVHATHVLYEGSFTAPNAHELLVQGVNRLQVISLDEGSGRVVADYQGTVNMPLVNDIVIGHIDNTNRDAIFVNSSPAFILEATTSGPWKTLYTAPNPSLRFEGSIQFAGDRTPEIITNDPSFVRDTPTRYFSSYTYRDGQLYRNWRVYRTNVVNVHTVQFEQGGPSYLVASIYSTGKFVVLKRHYWPIVPMTSGLLTLVVLCGWVIRFRNRGVVRHA
jgi:hypothetical protein